MPVEPHDRNQGGPLTDLWSHDRRAFNAWLACFRAALKRRRGDALTTTEISDDMDAQSLLLRWPRMTLATIESIVETVSVIAITDGWSEQLRGVPGAEPNWSRIRRVIYGQTDQKLPWWHDPANPLNR